MKNAPRVGIPVDIVPTDSKNDGKAEIGKRGKKMTKKALNLVQQSTASMGKFDDKRPDEPERKKQNLKRKFNPVAGKEALNNERNVTSKIISSILRKSDPTVKTKKHVNIER